MSALFMAVLRPRKIIAESAKIVLALFAESANLFLSADNQDPDQQNKKMKNITIYTSESGTRSENVEQSDAASHIAAGGSFATESQVLLAFIESEEVPSSLEDGDGDAWKLTNQGSKGNEDFYSYELA